MLSLLKKKSEAATTALMPAWHPNFRNYERLPDIKVVRTAFFVNGAAISIVLALGIYFGMHEWQLRGIRVQVTEAESRIKKNKIRSEQSIVLFRKFQAEATKVNEVDAFIKAKPSVSALLLRLGETLPSNIAIDGLDLRDTGLNLRVTVRGTPENASGYVTAYLEQLRNDKELAVLFDEFRYLSAPARNAVTGRMNAEFFLRLKTPPPKKP